MSRRFRWVECQFRALALCPPNQHLLEKLLSSLPESLDDTYVRMLRNITPNLIEYAQSMLNILCCAVRPLSDQELLDALAVKVGKKFLYDPARRFNNLDALEAICPGFIEVVTDFDTRNVTVRIAHFSVQEFLEAERILRYQDIASFHIKRSQGHTHMAAICLALLLVGSAGSGAAAQASPALEYYGRYWPEHLVQCDARAKIENEGRAVPHPTTGTPSRVSPHRRSQCLAAGRKSYSLALSNCPTLAKHLMLSGDAVHASQTACQMYGLG